MNRLSFKQVQAQIKDMGELARHPETRGKFVITMQLRGKPVRVTQMTSIRHVTDQFTLQQALDWAETRRRSLDNRPDFTQYPTFKIPLSTAAVLARQSGRDLHIGILLAGDLIRLSGTQMEPILLTSNPHKWHEDYYFYAQDSNGNFERRYQEDCRWDLLPPSEIQAQPQQAREAS